MYLSASLVTCHIAHEQLLVVTFSLKLISQFSVNSSHRLTLFIGS